MISQQFAHVNENYDLLITI